MATDGRCIVYNAAFVDKLSAAELEGTLAHEVFHCALGHQCRRGGRDPKLWNQAADFAINPILVANGFTLPAGASIDPAFNNLSAEEIYARLLQKGSGAGQNQAAQQPPGSAGTSSSPSGVPGASAPETPNGHPTSTPQQAGSHGSEGSEGSPARPGGIWRGVGRDRRRRGQTGFASRDAAP